MFFLINCLSTNCTFNNSGKCNCSFVKIEGFDACVTPETYCKSFIENTNNSFTNSYTNSTNDSQHLVCSAKKCMFNFSGDCKASSIQVNYLNNTCETFRKRSYDYEY